MCTLYVGCVRFDRATVTCHARRLGASSMRMLNNEPVFYICIAQVEAKLRTVSPISAGETNHT